MDDLKALNRRFYEEIIHKGNLDVVDELVDDSIVEHIPFPGQGSGREGVKHVIRALRTAFPDIHFEVEAEFAEGELVGAAAKLTGTHQGELLGIPPTGKAVSVYGLDMSRVRNGKFVEHWGLFDTTEMMRQLGVAPAGAPPS